MPENSINSAIHGFTIWDFQVNILEKSFKYCLKTSLVSVQMNIRTFHCNLKRNLSRWLKEYWILHTAVVVYILVLSIAVLVRHYSFESSAWDLGIFSQACYSTLNGKLFYYTIELYANPGGSFFGVHFSPILFTVLPFYAVLPAPETLLIIQTVILAVGAYPIFLLAREILSSKKLGLYFSLLYLLNPLVYGMNMFDFHPDAFFVPLALLSLYFFVKEKWIYYFTFMVFSFLTKEFMSLSFLVFAVGELLSIRKEVLPYLRQKKTSSKKIFVLFFTIITALLWFMTATWFIRYFNPNPPSGYVQGAPWKLLGVNPLNPSSWVYMGNLDVLSAIKFDLQSKLLYVIIILAPLAFLPVFKLSRFLPVLFWLFFAFLSNYPFYYSLASHYSALFIPFLMVAAIEGFSKLGITFRLEKNRLNAIARKLLLVGALSSLTFTFAFLPATELGFHMITNHDRKVAESLSWIRQAYPNASILTQYDLFPHISNSINSYVIPPPFSAFKKEYYFEYVASLFDKKIDYVIIDVNPDVRTSPHYMTHMVALKNLYTKGSYGLYASIDGLLIYKFGYASNLTRFEPFTIHNRLNETEIDADTILFSCFLPPGDYEVTYNIKISRKINEKVFAVEIDQNRSVVATRDVFGTDFVEEDRCDIFRLSMKISDPTEEVQFWITNPSVHTEIQMDLLEIAIINHLR